MLLKIPFLISFKVNFYFVNSSLKISGLKIIHATKFFLSMKESQQWEIKHYLFYGPFFFDDVVNVIFYPLANNYSQHQCFGVEPHQKGYISTRWNQWKDRILPMAIISIFYLLVLWIFINIVSFLWIAPFLDKLIFN